MTAVRAPHLRSFMLGTLLPNRCAESTHFPVAFWRAAVYPSDLYLGRQWGSMASIASATGKMLAPEANEYFTISSKKDGVHP